MDYQLSIEQHPAFIHVTVTGLNSRETVAAYLRDVVEECRTRNCFRVLIEERLKGPRLQLMDVFSVAAEGAMTALGVFQAIAYVDEYMGEMAEFAETVAVNRGMPVRVFTSVGEASTWLLRQDDASSGMDIFMDREGRDV
jgi:hypothetical protein